MKFTLEQIAYLVDVRVAKDASLIPYHEFMKLRKKSDLIAYSEDEFGMTGALLRDKNSFALYALIGRSTRLYFL